MISYDLKLKSVFAYLQRQVCSSHFKKENLWQESTRCKIWFDRKYYIFVSQLWFLGCKRVDTSVVSIQFKEINFNIRFDIKQLNL